MRIEKGEVLSAARQAGNRLLRRTVGRDGFGRRSRGIVGAAIVALCAGTVASMVASVVLGPFGDQVMARDGYANRDHYEATGGGIVGALFGFATERPREASLPAPSWTQSRHRPRFTRIADRSFRHRSERHVTRLASGGPRTSLTHSVCVRLCDGFFFPVGDVHGAGDVDTQTAVCSSACPGAPTRLFTVPSSGSDMDKATAALDGKPYTALPVAFAHTTGVGPTCTCHAEGQGEAALMSPMRDITMRDGDTVMTAVGWRVFKGNGHWPYGRRNFTSLAAAKHIPVKTRTTLTALENATLGRSKGRVAASDVLDIRVRRPFVRLKGLDGHEVRLIGTETVIYR